MPSPKTATLRLEIVNDDGSKTVVTTAELDASNLPHNRHTRPTDSPEHIVIGMKDPFYDESDWFERRDRWVDDNFRRFRISSPETHFSLQLQLPPVKSGEHVYTIQTIEAPDTRVIMMYHPGTNKAQLTSWKESDVLANAEHWRDTIYFFLDIP